MNTILIHAAIAVVVLFIWWLALVVVQAWKRRKEPDLARLLVQWQEEDAEYRRMHALATRHVHERILRWTEYDNQRNEEIRRQVYEAYRRYSQNWNTDWAIRNRQHGDYWYSTVRVFRDEPPRPSREIEDKVDWVHEGF